MKGRKMRRLIAAIAIILLGFTGCGVNRYWKAEPVVLHHKDGTPETLRCWEMTDIASGFNTDVVESNVFACEVVFPPQLDE